MRRILAVVLAVVLSASCARAYTCADMLAARDIDSRGPPFSAATDDMVRYVVTMHPSVAADSNKLSAVGYLTGVYCGEPGHARVRLHAVIDDMVEALGDE